LFLLANALVVGPLAQREYVALALLAAVVCILGDAGSRLGLDPYLPRWLSWSGGAAPKTRSKSA